MIPPYNPLIPTDIIRISATRYTIPFRFYITFTLDRCRPATATYLLPPPLQFILFSQHIAYISNPSFAILYPIISSFQPLFCLLLVISLPLSYIQFIYILAYSLSNYNTIRLNKNLEKKNK